MFEFLNKLSINKGINIGFIFFGAFLAPYWFLFEFAQDIFNKYQFVQTVVLALAIGVPICLTNYAINVAGIIKKEEKETEKEKTDRVFKYMGIACFMSGFSLYTPSIVKFFEPTLDQHSAIISIIAIHLGYIISNITDSLSKKFRKRKNK